MSFWLALVLIWCAGIVGFFMGALLTKNDDLCWYCGRARQGPS